MKFYYFAKGTSEDCVILAFLTVLGALDGQNGWTQADNIAEANIVILNENANLRDYYNEQQFFVVLRFHTKRRYPAQPDNVCALNALKLFGPLGFARMNAMIEEHQERLRSAPEQRLPQAVSSDEVVQLARRYKILVVDDKRENRETARQLLGERHELTVADSLRDAVTFMSHHQFDAVLTDMEMPPDKTYAALNPDVYPVDRTVEYGFAVTFEATSRGYPVVVVTDGNHHNGWVSAMFDQIRGATVNGQRVLFFNNIGKRWDKALKALMEPS
jgi:CheY-like chemotaxis protein